MYKNISLQGPASYRGILTLIVNTFWVFLNWYSLEYFEILMLHINISCLYSVQYIFSKNKLCTIIPYILFISLSWNHTKWFSSCLLNPLKQGWFLIQNNSAKWERHILVEHFKRGVKSALTVSVVRKRVWSSSRELLSVLWQSEQHTNRSSHIQQLLTNAKWKPWTRSRRSHSVLADSVWSLTHSELLEQWSFLISTTSSSPTSLFYLNTDQRVCCTQEMMWQL